MMAYQKEWMVVKILERNLMWILIFFPLNPATFGCFSDGFRTFLLQNLTSIIDTENSLCFIQTLNKTDTESFTKVKQALVNVSTKV
jgi:hypothetical protein